MEPLWKWCAGRPTMMRGKLTQAKIINSWFQMLKMECYLKTCGTHETKQFWITIDTTNFITLYINMWRNVSTIKCFPFDKKHAHMNINHPRNIRRNTDNMFHANISMDTFHIPSHTTLKWHCFLWTQQTAALQIFTLSILYF